jgi:hypothetical protein
MPLCAAAAELYGMFVGQSHAGEDFSAIIRFCGRPGRGAAAYLKREA